MTALYRNRAVAAMISDKLKIFAQPQRLMILSFLLSGEFPVTEIDQATGIGQPALSQQLAALRRAGLVDTRREAKQIYYRLAGNDVMHCVTAMETMFSRGEQQPRKPALRVHRPAAAAKPVASTGAASFATIIKSP